VSITHFELTYEASASSSRRREGPRRGVGRARTVTTRGPPPSTERTDPR
jgi:hypothetical protein